METGPNAKFARRVSQQDSLLCFCYLQLTDTPGLRGPKLYRGFESIPLRHSVSTAENICGFSLEIRETCPYSRQFRTRSDWRERTTHPGDASFETFSLKGY